MKFYAILPVFIFVFLLTGCLKGDDEETAIANEKVVGTFFTDAANSRYVVSDTATGDKEFTLFIRNPEGLNFDNFTRFYMEFNNAVLINDTSSVIDCVDYKVIPVRNIVNIDENTPDTLAKDDNFSLKRASISHNYLNIQYDFRYNNQDSHYFYITKNGLNQPVKDTVEIMFHHKSLESPPFYQQVKPAEQTKFVISIPIAELQNIHPLQDSVFIRILPQHDRITSKAISILYDYGTMKNAVPE